MAGQHTRCLGAEARLLW